MSDTDKTAMRKVMAAVEDALRNNDLTNEARIVIAAHAAGFWTSVSLWQGGNEHVNAELIKQNINCGMHDALHALGTQESDAVH